MTSDDVRGIIFVLALGAIFSNFRITYSSRMFFYFRVRKRRNISVTEV